MHFALGSVVEPRKLGRVVVETMFWLNRSGKLKRRPDLAFVSAEKWPLTKNLPRAKPGTSSPTWPSKS